MKTAQTITIDIGTPRLSWRYLRSNWYASAGLPRKVDEETDVAMRLMPTAHHAIFPLAKK